MPKPCSLDLREHVLDAVETGASRRNTRPARRFKVSVNSAVRWQSWHDRKGRDPAPPFRTLPSSGWGAV
jgi:transposase